MTSRVTVLDGGMGRELLRIGAPFRQPEWSALALTESPQHVVQAHRNFIGAGAQVITTNSYALVPFHIGEERFVAEARTLAELSGTLAREASDGAPHPVRVAGSLPPLFGSYRPDLFDAADAARIIDPLIAGLAGHVDIWLGETLSSIVEATTVREALDRAGAFRQPLWISYSLNEHGALRSGEPVADAVATAIDIGATTILFNCCAAESITTAIDIAVATADGAAAIGGYANRFVTAHTDDGAANAQISAFRDDLDPESYGQFVTRWLNAGATVVGGCCGMEPAHIAQIAAIVGGK